MSLLAVGTVAFDDIETPLDAPKKLVGGACTYISLAASYFVTPVRVVSVVGDDFPEDTLGLPAQHEGLISKGCRSKKAKSPFFGQAVTTAT
jgi:hypothetical protein